MHLDDLIWMTFWIFQAIKFCGLLTSFFSKREYFSLQLVTSVLGLIGAVTYELLHGMDWQVIFIPLWAVYVRLDYKAWKKHKDDDDDDHRAKRWSWVKNRLPKPETRSIPQPI